MIYVNRSTLELIANCPTKVNHPLCQRRGAGPSRDEFIRLPWLLVIYRLVHWTSKTPLHDRLDQYDHHASKPSFSFFSFGLWECLTVQISIKDFRWEWYLFRYSVPLFISFSCWLDCCLDLGFHLSSSKWIFIPDLLSPCHLHIIMSNICRKDPQLNSIAFFLVSSHTHTIYLYQCFPVFPACHTTTTTKVSFIIQRRMHFMPAERWAGHGQ